MRIFLLTLRRAAMNAFLTCSIPLAAYCQIDCGQTAAGPVRTKTPFDFRTLAADPVTIDYAVFYTPEARETEGSEGAILQKISTAFEGANQIFSSSGASIVHRVVHTQELPINNTSQTLPELNTELATGFNFFTVLDSVKADTSIIIVKFQLPGGYANIPLSPSQAGRGGGINLGLQNVSGSVLAHEIGHTLGASHDYPDSQRILTYIPPTYNYGNHFIGAGTGTCYRTIMSALTTCRIAGYENLPAVSCNLFSSPALLFDGTPTGDPIKADEVRMFTEFAPYVGSARGDSEFPDPGSPTPTPSPGLEEDRLTLKIVKADDLYRANGRCTSIDGSALTGDEISLYLLNRRRQTERLIKTVSCSSAGKYRARFRRGGRIQARNLRTGTESKIVRSS